MLPPAWLREKGICSINKLLFSDDYESKNYLVSNADASRYFML